MNKPTARRPPTLAIYLSILATALLLTACDDPFHPDIRITGPDGVVGSGQVASESRAVAGFHGVAMSGVGQLLIDRNGSERLIVTAEDNVLPYLTSTVAGGLLELGITPGVNLSTSRQILYEVSARTLDEIRVSGAGLVEAIGVDTPSLYVDLSGAANVTTFGQADNQEIHISGAGRYDGAAVSSRVVTVTVSGAGLARVRVADLLTATVSGAGAIEYYGDPVIRVNGGGTVRRMGP